MKNVIIVHGCYAKSEETQALTTLLKTATGGYKPVVYLDGDPHSAAADSLRYKYNQL